MPQPESAFLRHGLRAFGAPLLTLVIAAGLLSAWHGGLEREWLGVGVLAFAGWSGWLATRRLRRSSAQGPKTK